MRDLFDPNLRELDMIWLSALIFLPAAVALVLFLIPARFKEGMRWVALFGTAGTLTLSLCTVIDLYRVLEFISPKDPKTLYDPWTSLEARLQRQQSAWAASPVPTGDSFRSDDLIVYRPWVERFDVYYALGVDGINLSLVVLTALVTMLAVIASWKIEDKLRGYLVLLLTLETGVIGAFLSLDLFLFYVFYEVMLLPMYFLIGVWGAGRRKYAAVKFVIYTLFGSVGLLAAIIALYSLDVRDFVDQNLVKAKAAEIGKEQRLPPDEARKAVEIHTFDLFTLSRAGQAAMLILSGQEERLTVRPPRATAVRPGSPAAKAVPLFATGVNRDEAVARLKASPLCNPRFQYLLFGLLFVGFAVKVPIVPLHSWLPDAHVEAPTPISMILAGVLLKLGGYGLVRIAYPICPWAASELSWWVGLIGVIGIVYGALVAMAQTDFKKLLAYSSVSHMGYVVLGLACWSSADRARYWEWGVNGAVFQMIAHGITASALFFVVGVIYDRAHHREINRFGGLMEPMPVYGGLSAILFFASMGLPGLCGFVGEVMVMLAAWNYSPALAVPAILTTILTAGYLLWTWQRVYLGTNPATKDYPDVSPREFAVLFPFVVLSIVLGVIPSLVVFQWMEPSVYSLVESLARLR
jgi:NADH-quinone oxidoreductase subunit M